MCDNKRKRYVLWSILVLLATLLLVLASNALALPLSPVASAYRRATTDVSAGGALDAGQTLLFEDFNDGIADGFQEIQTWDCQGPACALWEVVNGEYRIYGANDMASSPMAAFGDPAWCSYDLDVDVRLDPVDGTSGHIDTGYGGESGGVQFYWVERDSWWYFSGPGFYLSESKAWEYGRTYHMSLQTTADQASIYVDGSLLSSQPLTATVCGKGGIGVGEANGYFDNVRVWTGDALPTSTPTATATKKPTKTPTATPTATNTPRPTKTRTATATATATSTKKPTKTPTATATPSATGTATPIPTLYVKRVNAGGPRYVDSFLHVWAADKPFSAGSWGYVGPTTGTLTTTMAISGTIDDVLYQSERNSMTAYKFVVPSGAYSVTLKFAEIKFDAANKRVFDVQLEGTPVLTNFDIWVAAGHARYAAVDKTFSVTVTDGTLNINFIPHASVPKISAILVEQKTRLAISGPPESGDEGSTDIEQ